MKIAVEGCAHGELDKIYEAVQRIESENNIKIDLLIICGDFQAVRNRDDLQCMAVPPKYQKLNTFYKYYSGEKIAPVLTIFIGGNHEASNFLSELSYGGWVCPSIYYLGNASVINVGGVRIAGISGIYKGQNYLQGHFECPPYDESTKRSVYHVRNIEVFRLKQVSQPLDICISHDWPRGVYNFGNAAELLRFKPFFRNEIESNKLGSRPTEELLQKLKPKYWFAAHLHCKFAAVIPHETEAGRTFTKFLALDKCLPRRKFLQVFDIESEDVTFPLKIKYDPEWLCILRSTNHLLSTTKQQTYMPGPGCSSRWDFRVTEDEMQELEHIFNGDFTVPENFQHTATPITSSQTSISQSKSPKAFINSQTTILCERLEITDPLSVLLKGSPKSVIQDFSFVEDLNVTNISERSIDPDSGLSEDEALNVGAKVTDVSNIDLSNCSFYVDTKGSPSEPKMMDSASRQALHVSYTGSVTASALPPQFADFPELKEATTSSCDSTKRTSAGNATVKVFKRRNLSMYMNQDEDSN